MVRIVCSYCQRFHFVEGESELGDSHSVCVRCLVCDPNTRGLFSEDELKAEIRKDLNRGFEWEGEDLARTQESDLKIYQRLLFEVQTEARDGAHR